MGRLGKKQGRKEGQKERRKGKGESVLFSLPLDLFCRGDIKIFNNRMAGHWPSRKTVVLWES